MDYATYIDRTDYDSVDAVRAGIDTGAAEAALEAFYDKGIDGITEDIIREGGPVPADGLAIIASGIGQDGALYLGLLQHDRLDHRDAEAPLKIYAGITDATLDDEVGFGKHSQLTIAELIEAEPDYTDWVMDAMGASSRADLVVLIYRTRDYEPANDVSIERRDPDKQRSSDRDLGLGPVEQARQKRRRRRRHPSRQGSGRACAWCGRDLPKGGGVISRVGYVHRACAPCVG